MSDPSDLEQKICHVTTSLESQIQSLDKRLLAQIKEFQKDAEMQNEQTLVQVRQLSTELKEVREEFDTQLSAI